MNRCLYLGLMFVLPALLSGQDPFFIHFYGNESAYNPALVGYKGSTSFSAKYKSQWAAGTVPAFRSTWVNFEESMPCNLLDYGLNLNYDEEGVGVFRTYDIGLKVAGTIPFDIGKSGNNIRLGLSLQRSVKTIDFTRLIFSDQLDPKFGLVDANGDPIPTGFVPPDESGSHPFFTPSAGFAYRILFNTGKKRSPTLFFGAAVHNTYSLLKDPSTGHEESLLGIGTRIPTRYSFFLSMDLVPYFEKGGDFLLLKIMAFNQRQAGLQYWEAGGKLSLNRALAGGIFYHFNSPPGQGKNTNWITYTLETGSRISKFNRVEVGFAFSHNLSGLKNKVGPVFELTFSYHLGKSMICGFANQDNDLTEDALGCPTSAQTQWRKKLYEGIWYKTTNK